MVAFVEIPSVSSTRKDPRFALIGFETEEHKRGALDVANTASHEIRKNARHHEQMGAAYGQFGYLVSLVGAGALVLSLLPAGAELVKPSTPLVSPAQKIDRVGSVAGVAFFAVAGLCALKRRRLLNEAEHHRGNAELLKRFRVSLRSELGIGLTPKRVRGGNTWPGVSDQDPRGSVQALPGCSPN